MSDEFQRVQIAQEIMIEATREKVFSALLSDTKSWWGAPYISVENCTDISIEPKVGGKFFETWGKDEGRIWGHVTRIKRNECLEVTGPFCMSGAVHAVVCFELESKGSGTILKLTHEACGYISEASKSQYAFGWKDLLGTRLKSFVESGKKFGLGQDLPPNFSKK
jgi:uncharacterized protein YndB with AHSA1/START domain